MKGLKQIIENIHISTLIKNYNRPNYSGKKNIKNWFSIPRKQRNYITAHALEIDASFSSLSIAFLPQAVKELGNNLIISFFPQANKKLLLTAVRKRQGLEMSSLTACIPWMTVGLAESVAIVTLNLCTIISFMRNRNLRKRSTYLVINLAVTDMFVGGVVVYYLFYRPGVDCNLWQRHLIHNTWTNIFIEVLKSLFPIASLTNITIIALERLHATFFPFKHRVLKKWVYGLIIAVVWVTAGLATVSYRLLVLFGKRQTVTYSRFTFLFICLLIICVSYTSIATKIRCGEKPKHHGAESRERKLTITLFIVTVVSLLLYLPNVVFFFVSSLSKSKIYWPVLNHVEYTLVSLFFANSFVNSILYAIRMPEYRSAFLALFRRRAQQQRQVAVLPLLDM